MNNIDGWHPDEMDLSMNSERMSELFGGGDRYRALRAVYEHPQKAFGPRELAQVAGIDAGNASRWLRRWAGVGLVDREGQARQAKYRASSDPALVHLGLLLRQGSQMMDVLQRRVDELGDRVEAAAVFGSVAMGNADSDSDIDILMWTSMPRLEAQAWFKPAGRELQKQVNVLVYTKSAWVEAVRQGDPFVLDILSHPMMMLKGEMHAQKT